MTPTLSELGALFEKQAYIADPELTLSVWLALSLDKPLLLEGPSGVGKTELAHVLSKALQREEIRLPCYEGLDAQRALYEWDYGKQMLYAGLLREAVAKRHNPSGSLSDAVTALSEADDAFFSERFLVRRPLLRAITSPRPTVLLIDEIDRADPEFEALLLEVLSDGEITIPELGTMRGPHRPVVVLTTNATRELSDALRRRCLVVFVDYPPPPREQAILEARLPGVGNALTEAVTHFVAKVRTLDLQKSPSVAETLEWARALMLLGKSVLDRDLVRDTLGLLVKHKDDRDLVEDKLATLLPKAT